MRAYLSKYNLVALLFCYMYLFYILILCQPDVVSHVDDAEDNDCVDAFTACNPFNPAPLPLPLLTLFTSRYTCCLCAYNTSHSVSNVISRQGWNDNVDRIDCQADVVDDGGLGTLPQL